MFSIACAGKIQGVGATPRSSGFNPQGEQMVGGTTEPRKRTRKRAMGRPKGDQPPKKTIAAFKGSEPFDGWLDGLVEYCRIPLSSVIELALILYAGQQGYEPKAPKR